MAPPMAERIGLGRAGASKTMLWPLHNRALEASRLGGVLTDPSSVSIHQALDYDFDREFGTPAGTLAARAAEIDAVLRRLDQPAFGWSCDLLWGLETQAREWTMAAYAR
jgi:hypothetical protein